MKKEVIYVCEICGEEYCREQDAQFCEKNHETQLRITKMMYGDGKVFPTRITVTAKNGATCEYKQCEPICRVVPL